MTDAQPRPRRKLLKRFLWLVGGLFLALVAIWFWAYFAAKIERDRRVAAWESQHAKLRWDDFSADVLARPHAQIDRQPLIDALKLVGGELNMNGPHVPELGKADLFSWNPTTTLAEFRLENQRQLALDVLARLAPAVESPPGMLSALRDSPRDPIATRLPFVGHLSAVSRLFRNEIRGIAKTDPRVGYRMVRVGLSLAEQLRHEPFPILQGIRKQLASEAIRTLLSMLGSHPPTQSECADFDRILANMQTDFQWRHTLDGEAAMLHSTLERAENLDTYLAMHRFHPIAQRRVPKFVVDGYRRAVASPLGAPVVLRAEAHYLELLSLLKDVMDNPPPWPKAALERFDALSNRSPFYDVGVSDDRSPILDWLGRYHNGVMHRRRLSMTRWAVRVVWYYERHRRLPERLEDVCDVTMPTIDASWFAGRPIRYTKTGATFRLEATHAPAPPIVVGDEVDMVEPIELTVR